MYTYSSLLLRSPSQAQNEALTALDFISLLVSKDAPTMAATSMSPLLKQLVPSGTLGFNKVQLPPPVKAQEEHNKTVCVGWNFKSVETAADALLNSAARLGEEMEREARYWEQVLSISEQQWPLCRMPKEKHTIGVRFGFSEGMPIAAIFVQQGLHTKPASPYFHSRGLAALRPDANGYIILDQGLSKKPKSLRIRINDAGLITSTSGASAHKGYSQAGHEGIEALICQARDSLLDEELFHELLRELRGELLNYGVNLEDHVIRIPIETHNRGVDAQPQRTILIDLIDREEHQTQTRSIDEGPNTTLNIEESHVGAADIIPLALRIFLTHAYRLRFRTRSDPPPPVSEEKRVPPVHSLLRPVIAHLQHASAVRGFRDFLVDTINVLKSAGLSARFDTHTVAPDFSKSLHLDSSGSASSIAETLLATLDEPLKVETSMQIVSPISGHDYSVQTGVTTHLSPPAYGTLFETIPPTFLAVENITNTPSEPESTTAVSYNTLSSAATYISHLICRAVAQSMASYESVETTPTDDQGIADRQWKLEENGTDLRRVWIVAQKVRRLSVTWQEGGLMIVCAENGVRARVLGLWKIEKVGEGKSQAGKTLQEVMEIAGKLGE